LHSKCSNSIHGHIIWYLLHIGFPFSRLTTIVFICVKYETLLSYWFRHLTNIPMHDKIAHLLVSLRTCKHFQNISSIDIVHAKPRHHLRSIFKRGIFVKNRKLKISFAIRKIKKNSFSLNFFSLKIQKFERWVYKLRNKKKKCWPNWFQCRTSISVWMPVLHGTTSSYQTKCPNCTRKLLLSYCINAWLLSLTC
jgi:hypothetical protein